MSDSHRALCDSHAPWYFVILLFYTLFVFFLTKRRLFIELCVDVFFKSIILLVTVLALFFLQ